MATGKATGRWWMGCLFLLLATGVWLSVTNALDRYRQEFRYAGAFDWPFFVEAAKRHMATGKIYEQDPAAFYPGAPVYKFPPLLASIIELPLQHGLSEAQVREAFAVVHVVVYLACAGLLASLFWADRNLAYFALVIIFAGTFESFIVNFYRLQPEIFILFSLVVSMHLVLRKKYFCAGIPIGIATALKIYPALFILYFLLGKPLRSISGCVLGFGLALLFSIPVVGFSEHWRYLTEIMPILSQEEIYLSAENVSAGAALLSWSSVSSRWAIWLGNMVWLMGGLWLVVGYWRCGSIAWQRRETVCLAFSVLMATFVLGTKNSWWNYQLLLMLPILVGLGASLGGWGRRDIPALLMILLSCGCIYFMNAARWAPLLLLDYSPLLPGFVANLLIWVAVLRLFWRSCRQ